MAAVSRTIELFEPASWHDAVAQVVAVRVPPSVIERLRRVKGEDMFHDTMEYLTRAFRRAGTSLSDEALNELREAVLAPFDFFRGYHGCRPLSINSYAREGLQPLTRERLAALAYDLFEGTVPREEVAILSRQAKLDTRQDAIYFTADRTFQIEQCGHYMIYGCESLCCLWRDEHGRPTSRFLESQRRARAMGVPTLFACEVPLRMIRDGWRQELAHSLITKYFRLQSNRPEPLVRWSRNWALAISEPLPPEFLRSHEHPAVIIDPLAHNTKFRNEHVTCALCAPTVPKAR
jgi:hypothetical protein